MKELPHEKSDPATSCAAAALPLTCTGRERVLHPPRPNGSPTKHDMEPAVLVGVVIAPVEAADAGERSSNGMVVSTPPPAAIAPSTRVISRVPALRRRSIRFRREALSRRTTPLVSTGSVRIVERGGMWRYESSRDLFAY